MDRVFRVSKENPQARCRAYCEGFDDAGAEKTYKPGGAGSQAKTNPLQSSGLGLLRPGLRRVSPRASKQITKSLRSNVSSQR